jgi:hypothetical protein
LVRSICFWLTLCRMEQKPNQCFLQHQVFEWIASVNYMKRFTSSSLLRLPGWKALWQRNGLEIGWVPFVSSHYPSASIPAWNQKSSMMTKVSTKCPSKIS